ncbi:MAG TPA: hypothetical protein DDW49_06980 [Deltaproteobacteria bacterium]|nr:MAG: hypothetical protein A2048_07395 [Deltaproteobacteria bacterium GWA2_45_12]HBF13114.1 hypothetical protein [Deltaproteobacteria bacterium]
MKNILYISQSRLSHNLLRALLPYLPEMVQLTCVDRLNEALLLPKMGKPYQLVIIDWNTLAGHNPLEPHINDLNRHPLITKAPKILIHSYNQEIPKEILTTKGFVAFYTKPFLTDELINIMVKWTKKQSDLFVELN